MFLLVGPGSRKLRFLVRLSFYLSGPGVGPNLGLGPVIRPHSFLELLGHSRKFGPAFRPFL